MLNIENTETQKYLNDLWRDFHNLPKKENHLRYEDLKKSEWNTHFESLMRNRLIMGAFRYGKIGSSNKPMYDRVSSIVKRIEKYAETGNKELLVDCANLCLLEFTECHHPKDHFQSEDDGEHVQIMTK